MFGQMWWWGSGQVPKYANQEQHWRRLVQHTNYKFISKDEVVEAGTRQPAHHDDHGHGDHGHGDHGHGHGHH